jgi:hypothetical protein
MGRELDVTAIRTDIVSMSVGYSGAIFFGQTSGLLSSIIFYISGGTLQITGALNGTTMAGASLAAASWNNLPVGNPGYPINGPAAFYLAAAGASTVAHIVRNFSVIV